MSQRVSFDFGGKPVMAATSRRLGMPAAIAAVAMLMAFSAAGRFCRQVLTVDDACIWFGG